MFHFVSFVSGLLFGLGLVLSKMADPGKVIAFLDFTGCWDPSLAFVMAGAVGVGLAGFACARKTGKTWLGVPMQLPHATRIDWRLVAGSAVSGQGGDLPAFARGPHWSLFQPASSRQPFSSFSCLPAWDCMHW